MASWQIPLSLASFHATTHSTPTCSPGSLRNITLPNATIHALTASAVHNYTFTNTLGTFAANTAANYTNLTFCNVTVTYSHAPHHNDTTHVTAWLPLAPGAWNGRFQGTGGGGFQTGEGAQLLAPAVGQGYAAASTDGGHAGDGAGALPAHWALEPDGAVDAQRLLDFAHLSLHEMTVLGKAAAAAVYGRAPRYAYWHGCSTGGRQGLAMAQRYPDAYDGILALSPAINWERAIVSEYWGQFVMNRLGYYPLRCELQAITAAAVEACDGLDGVVDGIISLPGLCHFDATILVGSSFNCSGTELSFSPKAAEIVNAAWTGPWNSTSGELAWYGLMRGAGLVASTLPGLLDTNCTNATDASTCSGGIPFEGSADWIQYFLLKDPDYDLATLSFAEYEALSQQSIDEYTEIIGTADADLSAFRAGGGKMITSHGLADSLIFPNGSTKYYDRVLKNDAAAQDFYRLFLLPGVPHCFAAAPGPYPTAQLEALTDWVERGVAPDTLTTSFSVVSGGHTGERPACVYPAVQTYIGGDPYEASSFTCE